MIENLFRHIRLSFKSLLRNPGLSLAAILTLALGIGANTAIFSVINAVLLRALPFEDADKLVTIWQSSPLRDVDQDVVAPANFVDWREQNSTLSDLAAVHYLGSNVKVEEPERVRSARVSANFFHVLGVQPVHGRAFSPEEDRAGAEPVVIVSQSFWERHFGADRGALGRSFTVGERPHKLIGVMPRGFKLFRDAELWTPLSMDAEERGSRSRVYLYVFGRLRPGVSLEQADRDLATVARRLEQEYTENEGWGVKLVPLEEQVFSHLRAGLLILFGAVVFVLLVCCANVANLLLARAVGREREIATRVALGATKGQLTQQLLVESFAISLSGGLLGVILAGLGVKLLVLHGPAQIDRIDETSIDLSVLAFTLGISVLTGVMFGLAPVFKAVKPDLTAALKSSNGRITGRGAGRLAEKALVVSEVVLALVLLTGAGLMLRGLYKHYQAGPGFDSENRLTMRLMLSGTKFPESPPRVSFYRGLIEELEALPGVQRVAGVTTLPLSGSEMGYYFTIDGRPEPPPGEEMGAGYDLVTPGYFELMGIPLLKGRFFSEFDDSEHPQVAIVSESLARRYLGSDEAIGQRVRFEDDGPAYEVVGIVGDVRHSQTDFRKDTRIYLPYAQSPMRTMSLVVKTDSDPLPLSQSVRRRIWNQDSELPVSSVKTYEKIVSDSFGQTSFITALLSIFAVLTLFLAAVGIYGVIAYSVGQRTREIGVRYALGAKKTDIYRLVVGQGLVTIVIGLAIGLLGGYGITQAISSLLAGLEANDPVVFIGIALIMTLTAVVASLIPARRAVKVNPVVALRLE